MSVTLMAHKCHPSHNHGGHAVPELDVGAGPMVMIFIILALAFILMPWRGE